LLAVNGADAYVSPDWYVSPDQVPTWLYQVVHLSGPVRAMSGDELAEQIETLSAKFEERLLPKKPWLSSKMTAGRLEALKKAIVGLEMTVEEVEGSFKLSQHKSETDFAAIRGSLAAQADAGAQQIAHLMRQARPQAFAAKAARNEPARKDRAMTLTDSHQPKTAGASTKPAVFVDGGSGTTGSAFRSGCGCRTTSW
jgi:transcriptional regulator